MAYSTDTNNRITEFINRAQTRIGEISTLIASKVARGSRRESYSAESELGFFLDSFIKSLDSNFNDWTEAQVVQYIDMWSATAKLNSDTPYFTHEQYNLNILFSQSSSTSTFSPTADLNMLGFKITNLASGSAASDAVNKAQLDGKVSKGGDSMTGPLAMGGQKITGLAAGTVNGDALRFEQLPTSLPPSGAAGGDLSGTYPNPSVNDDSHSHTPGSTIPAYPTTLPPNGPAGGDLGGNYPNPAIPANSLSASKLADGTVTSSKLAAGVAASNLGYTPVNKAGDSMTGALAMGSHKITGLTNGSASGDAATWDQLAGVSQPAFSGAITLINGWTGTIKYRISTFGLVTLTGILVGSGASANQFCNAGQLATAINSGAGFMCRDAGSGTPRGVSISAAGGGSVDSYSASSLIDLSGVIYWNS